MPGHGTTAHPMARRAPTAAFDVHMARAAQMLEIMAVHSSSLGRRRAGHLPEQTPMSWSTA